MKSKKRHHQSSDDSEESDASAKSSSSSDSDSDDSSVSAPRHKKKRKRVDSSDSDSNSDDQKRAKKRKHKKKKKKQNKKKRRSESYDDVSDDVISISEGEISPKKKRKHKHKHSKQTHPESGDETYEKPSERHLHSVVKECRPSSDEGNQPVRTYYQKEYHHSDSREQYVQDRGAYKYYQEPKRSQPEHQENYNYERGRNNRFPPQDDKYNRQREKYVQHPQSANQDYRNKTEYDEYKRPTRYEEHRREEDHYKRDREMPYQVREETRGDNRHNRYEERGLKHREYDDGRDYRDRRGPAEPEHYRDKEYEKRERLSPDRSRDVRRDRPVRVEKPPPARRDPPRSRSREDRYSEKTEDKRDRRPEVRRPPEDGRPADDRRKSGDRRPFDDRRKDARAEGRSDDRRPEKSGEDRRNKLRERKSRFENEKDKEYSWGKTEVKKEGDKNPGDKEKPNFGLSGKLTAEANTVNGVVIKYTEPDDAKQPKRRWRFYPFKGDKALPILYIHRQSCFVMGRDKKVVDIALEHPSVSKQHAALQFRATPFTRDDGSQGRRVRPYIIDLESANGTFVNNKKLEPRRYVELLERDVVKFGFSQRDYVLLHENSKNDAQDDDQEMVPVTTTEKIKEEKRAKEVSQADD